jgi:hypothetical protein
MSIAAILAVLLAPILIRWSITLGNKPSEDGATFRPVPTLRAVYPGVLLAGLWGVSFYLNEAWKTQFALQWNDWLGLMGMTALSLTAILSWPPTVRTVEDGLHWSRLFGSRFIKWDQIKAADSGMDGQLTIYGHSGDRYEISQYIQGRSQLKALIQRRIGNGSDLNVNPD